MNRSILSSFSLLLLFNFGIIVRSATVSSYPHPLLNASSCNAPTSSYICDPSETFSVAERSTLGNITVKTASTVQCSACSCGSKKGFYIAIAMISNFTYSATSAENRAAEETAFVRKLLQYWKPSPCGNDVLLAIFTSKRRLIITYGNVSKNIPILCAKEVQATSTSFMAQGKYFKALESVIWEIRTVYRNSKSTSWPACFQVNKRTPLSPTAIILIVLSIVVAVAIAGFVVWHVKGQRRLHYLDYNPNNRPVRFNNYSGSSDYGVGEGGLPIETPPVHDGPSTVTGEYAMWQGSVFEGSYDNPGFAESQDRGGAC